MTTLHISPAPQFMFGGDCSVELQGDTVVFRVARLENLGASPLQPLIELWACPSLPENDSATGQRLASVSLDTLAPGATRERLELSALATASVRGKFQLILAVAKAESPELWEDQRLIEGAREFVHPELIDPVEFAVSPAGTEVSLGGYRSERPADNVSGSLSLDLWAEPAPCVDGVPVGHLIGQLSQGTINGGEVRDGATLRYLPADLSPGTYTLCLMLREWNGESYLTRDFRNAASPVSWPIEDAVSLAAIDSAMAIPAQAARLRPADASVARPPELVSAPPEAVEPVVVPSAAADIAAEAASVEDEVDRAPEPTEQDEPTGKVSFWRRFRQLFSKKA